MIQVHILQTQTHNVTGTQMHVTELKADHISHRVESYITECRGPVDLVVRADAGVLCLKSEGEGGDMEN